jgi:hypothetical protein
VLVRSGESGVPWNESASRLGEPVLVVAGGRRGDHNEQLSGVPESLRVRVLGGLVVEGAITSECWCLVRGGSSAPTGWRGRRPDSQERRCRRHSAPPLSPAGPDRLREHLRRRVVTPKPHRLTLTSARLGAPGSGSDRRCADGAAVHRSTTGLWSTADPPRRFVGHRHRPPRLWRCGCLR